MKEQVETIKRLIFIVLLVAAVAISAIIVTSCGNTQVQVQEDVRVTVERWEYKCVYYFGQIGLSLNATNSISYDPRPGDPDYGTVAFEYDMPDMNKLGSEGWELVDWERSPQGTAGQNSLWHYYFIFKRKIPDVQ